MRNRRIPIVGAFAAVLVVVLALAVIATRGSQAEQPAARDAGSTTQTDAASVAGSTASSAAAVPETTTVPPGPFTTPDMPLSVSTGATSGLRSGDVVSVTASPQNGSQAFGVEARLCRGDAAIEFDGQMLPTRAGLCIPKPFSVGTNDYVEIRNQPPYGPVTVNFTVGTGSQTFSLQDGSQATITCDATHPCQLALKLQYPNGFGFQGVPLTFG